MKPLFLKGFHIVADFKELTVLLEPIGNSK